jgi:hypothetical protein
MTTFEQESTADDAGDLCSLAEAVCNGTIATAQYERLNALLAADENAARYYATYLRMHGLLLWHWRDADVSPDSSPGLPIVVETSPLPVAATSLFTNLFSPGSYMFSYALAVFIVGIGLLIGWSCHVPLNQEVAAKGQHPAAIIPIPTTEHESTFVGQITGMADCRWADPKTATVCYAYVPLGRKYSLASGLMEITYDMGARVIMQGPCTYQVESGRSGFLTVGRLTARVEKKGEAERQKAESSSGDSTPLFSVRTPTATVSDLGTEFGVEVNKSGICRTHVYQGKVELRAVGEDSKAIVLMANESARADFGKDGVVAVVRQAGQKSALVREMPKPVAIAVFNTGIGLMEGEPDQHWQVVARSDDPTFKPRPAMVRGPSFDALQNDPAGSQWISLVAGEIKFPEDVIYTFRTSFNLKGMQPSTATLRGKFMADDKIAAIRLNGRNIPAPVQYAGSPFIYWTQFRIAAGFVEGINVLEFDVLNADPYKSPMDHHPTSSHMRCRVELEGFASPDLRLSGDWDANDKSQTPSAENKTTATRPKITKRAD